MAKEKEIERPSTIDYDHVELILKEADKYSLRWEVEQTAKVYVDRDNLPIVDAHWNAYHDWVK
tara:strand:+ start:232 stop:420 length:189 start_codon:yes stop_codon:yes gene_type:complete